MLDRFCENEPALSIMPGRFKDFPVFSQNDWRILREICALLKPLYNATMKVQSRRASISCIIPLIKCIDFELSRLNTEFPVVRDNLRETIKERFKGKNNKSGKKLSFKF